ncbi:MAG: general secretion pathway protein GspB [Pseudomonadota bacterium]
MSYILDALKKSERDRQRRQDPTMPVWQPEAAPAKSYAKLLWILGAIALVNIICVGVLVVVMMDRDDSSKEQVSSTSVSPAASAATDPSSVSTPAPVQVAEPKTSENIPEGYELISPGTTPTVSERVLPPPSNIMSLVDLPPMILQELPRFQFSSHLYTDNPLLRSIEMNGEKLGEGATSKDGLVVEQIDLRSIVLNHRGYFFRVDIDEYWVDS